MSRTPSIVLATILVAVAAGCQPFSVPVFAAVRGSGKAASEPRSVPAFTRIEVAGSIDTEVTIGGAQSVVVEGDDNLLANIRTDVKQGTLVIATEGSYNSRLGLRAKVAVPALDGLRIDGSGDAVVTGVTGPQFKVAIHGSGDLEATGSAERVEIEVHGSGEVQFTGLQAREASVSISGSGDVTLAGTVGMLTARSDGSGDIDGGELTATDASVTLHGSGDARVNASGSITARLHGSGNLVYSGSPKVDVERHGSGDVVRR